MEQWSASTMENTSASHPLLYVGTTKDSIRCIMYRLETEQVRIVCEGQ